MLRTTCSFNAITLTKEPWSISADELVEIRVVAVNNEGVSEYGSGSVRMPQSPAVITLSEIEELSDKSASVSWILSDDGGSAIIKTEIHLYKGSSDAQVSTFTVDNKFATSYEFTGLSPKTDYFY